MKAFSTLYTTLDASTATHDKQAALRAYFRAAAPADAAWAAYFLSGGKPRQVVPTRVLRTLAQRRAGLPEWLFDECYHTVGDLAETIAHVLPPPTSDDDAPLSVWITDRLLPLRGAAPEIVDAALTGYWDSLDWSGRFLLTKLIGGGFRVGVSRQSVIRALADIAGIDPKRIAHRMVGWTDSKRAPTAARYLALIAAEASQAPADAPAPGAAAEDGSPAAAQAALPLEDGDDARDAAAVEDLGLPYPFFLAQPLAPEYDAPDAIADRLGDRAQWQAEWKWDGIRTQLVKRGGQVWLWSRGEDLITDRFPEIAAAAADVPDGTVLDGEIVAWPDGTPAPAPFALLQQRITRKTVSRKVLADAPARYLVYDLLEDAGQDLRDRPMQARRTALETLGAMWADRSQTGGDDDAAAAAAASTIIVPPLVTAPDWATLAALREESRGRGVEGMLLKHCDSRYGVGRTRADGEWYKWKVAPYTVDAVLLYAQAGHGRRANLYTDYTFAVWDRPEGDAPRALVPFTKAYSGLTDAEIKRVDTIVRSTTVEKFGPVRSVRPTLLFEIAFEGIARSPRHKSGIAVRFPRILRWREDKPIDEADSLATLQALLAPSATVTRTDTDTQTKTGTGTDIADRTAGTSA